MEKSIKAIIIELLNRYPDNTYAELAVKLKCSETWVRALELGKKKPGRHLEAFIRAYHKKVVNK